MLLRSATYPIQALGQTLRGERVRAAQLLIYIRHLWVIGRSVDPRAPLQYQDSTKRSLKRKEKSLSAPISPCGRDKQIS